MAYSVYFHVPPIVLVHKQLCSLVVILRLICVPKCKVDDEQVHRHCGTTTQAALLFASLPRVSLSMLAVLVVKPECGHVGFRKPWENNYRNKTITGTGNKPIMADRAPEVKCTPVVLVCEFSAKVRSVYSNVTVVQPAAESFISVKKHNS